MSILAPKKIYVGLSGGVDSSVSAALLKKGGYDVTGVFIRVWHEDADARRYGRGLTLMNPMGGCQAADDRLDAMRVCAKLGIPFVELDLEREYKKEVVNYMIREYRAGGTPNPDVFCNRFIKFGGFYKYALAHGADYVATGHYARVAKAPNTVHKDQTKHKAQNRKPLTANRCTLHAGLDSNKDQSYFLWQLRKEQLPHILFPVGGMKKSKVRALAKKFDLITADKKDSQGLCFVGKVDMKEFLSHYITPKKGKILLGADDRGLGRGLTQMKTTVIGEHDGAFFYTLGERVGINGRHQMSTSCGHLMSTEANYVISKNMAENTLTVSHKDPSGKLPRARNEVTITDCNWLAEPQVGKTYGARVRYRQPLQEVSIKYQVSSMKEPAAVRRREKSLMPNTKYLIHFASPQTAAVGQSLVLYEGDVVIGGGIIAG